MSDVPTAGKRIAKSEFVNSTQLEATETEIETLKDALRNNKNDIEDARFLLNSSTLDYQNQRANFENWIKTRSATESSNQNAQVIERVEAIELLKLEERKAQRTVEALEQEAVKTNRALQDLQSQRSQILNDANAPYEKARKFEVLKVFMLRLALTLPLLLISGWMILKKRGSSYWPIYRSFILFSLFAFFVELVPYLPSYGGYVRYIVGILLALLFAHFSIKAMTRYLQNKKNEEKRPETEKRKLIEYETAVKKISDGVCPSCDRQFSAKKPRKGEGQPETNVDFCVHCGFCLFSKCTNCGERENSFYKFCGACGVPSGNEATPADV
ncbi:serine endopeptidase [Litoreibacter meonggei]|nr:serine endopeptidase [Litoreibacter meonggei]